MELLNTRMYKWRTEKTPSGLARHMDIILLDYNCTIYNKPLNTAQTIFINTRLSYNLIVHFYNNILPELTKPINLIIAGEDYTFPNNTDERMSCKCKILKDLKNIGKHKMINKVFAENLDENLGENVLPIPLGINSYECPVDINYFLKFENIDENKPLKVTNFNRIRTGTGQWTERANVMNLCETNWSEFFINVNNTNHRQYLQIMGSQLFTICVHGGGLDVNPKLWEALLIGVIPIIRENKPYTDIYERFDFPVVIVKNWDVDTINKDNLIVWYNKYYKYFTNNTKRKKMLDSLCLDFWVKYVNNFE
jgi:hypothetical protein